MIGTDIKKAQLFLAKIEFSTERALQVILLAVAIAVTAHVDTLPTFRKSRAR